MLLDDTRMREIDRVLKMGHYRPTDYHYDESGEKLLAAYYRGKKLRLRVRNWEENGRGGFQIDIACAATFDRWANSTDFVITIDPRRLLFALWQARSMINRSVRNFWQPDTAINLDQYARARP